MEAPVSTLKLTSALARHAAHAHAAVTSNLARADLPGAERLAVQSFEDMVRRGGEAPRSFTLPEAISTETEMLSLARAGADHQASLTLWKSTLNMLRVAAAGPR
jgi:flagellar basal body rod protein FlgB